MKRSVIILCACFLLITPMHAEAKTLTRYATKTVALKEKCSNKAKTINKVKVHTKLRINKEGKTWCRVEYKGQSLYAQKKYLHEKRCAKKYNPKHFKHRGVIRWGGCKWTWYTQRRLPGRGLRIPGRHLDKKHGYVLDKDGYICLASSIANKKKRAIVATPFGRYGKVYDTNGKGPHNWRDVYTNW